MKAFSDLKVGDKVQYHTGSGGQYVFGKIMAETRTQFTAQMTGQYPHKERFMKDGGMIIGTGGGWNTNWIRPFDQSKYDKQIYANKKHKLVDWFRSYSYHDLSLETLQALKQTFSS